MLGNRSRRWVLVAAPAFLLAAAAVVFAAAGSLDTSFGTGGVVQITGPNPDMAWAAVVQSDGKVVVAGRDTGSARVHWRIRRLLTDGTVDVGFGIAGQVTLFGESANDLVSDVALDGSGRILVAGWHSRTLTIAGTTTLTHLPTVVRLAADGTLDASFGSGGVVELLLPGTYTYLGTAKAVTIQPDGKILLAGDAALAVKKSYQYARFAARLADNGALDATFGVGGVRINDLTTGDDSLGDRALALQSDGRIVLGGAYSSMQSYAISRLLANGAVDTAFGAVRPAFYCRSLVVDGSNRILASGSSGGDAAVLRYTATGAVDLSFGVNGKATIHDAACSTGGGGGLAVRSDGKILVGTLLTPPSGTDYRIRPVRLHDTGQLDLAFGTGGVGDAVQTTAGAPNGLALAPDGGCFLVGWLAQVGVSSQRWFAARYLAD